MGENLNENDFCCLTGILEVVETEVVDAVTYSYERIHEIEWVKREGD